MRALPTQERLLELFEYRDGQLIKKKWTGGKVLEGQEAGCLRKSKGYRCVSVDNVLYQEHRVIWKLIYGEDPKYSIDHINGNRSDNRIENLRDVIPLVNSHNRDKSKNNTTGYLGVSVIKYNNKYKAQFRFNGKNKHIGMFDTPEEASDAYKSYKQSILNTIKEKP